MLESLVGLIVPATRQNAGMSFNRFPAGGVKEPAGTGVAMVMVVAGSASRASASQSAPIARGEKTDTKTMPSRRVLKIAPSSLLRRTTRGRRYWRRARGRRQIMPGDAEIAPEPALRNKYQGMQ